VEGGTGEAYKELNVYNEWLNQKPLIAKAFVVKSNVIKDDDFA
jgi:hypothetical protein